jgi:hypothetical protein
MQIIPLMANVTKTFIKIMSCASFFYFIVGINVTKWSWANYYKNACANKVSKVSPR